jgi:competence protein ComEC
MCVQSPTRPSSAGLGDSPLFHAGWLFALGILLSRAVWLRPGLVLVAMALLAVLCCVALGRARRIAWLPLGILWILLGAWCALVEPHPAPAPALAALSDGLVRTVEGTITDAGPVRSESEQDVLEAASTAPSQRIDLRVTSLEVVDDTEDRQAPMGGGVRLTVRWPRDAHVAPLRCGESIRAAVRLLTPESYRDPGVWSRTDYLLDEGLTSTATVSISEVEKVESPTRTSAACRVKNLQHEAADRLLALPAAMRGLPAALRLSQNDAIMLAAIVAGDRTYLSHSLRVGFERTGSFHMLVVSGLHLAIVAGCILWVMRRLRVPRVPATLLTIAASFAYAIFTGFAAPVQRSLWMVTIYLLGRLAYRERNPMNTIGFAALCLLTASPRSLFDSSLQMTMLAVLSIAGIAVPLLAVTVQPYVTSIRDLRLNAIDGKLAPALAQYRVIMRQIAELLEKIANGWVAWKLFPWVVRFVLRIVELVVMACVVELAMTLPMAVYFHRITLLALPVNMLILPLLAVLMPAAMLTLAMLLVWPAAAVVPATITVLALHLGVGLVHAFGSMALGDLRIPTPLVWQSAAFCALLAAAILLAQLRPNQSYRILFGLGSGSPFPVAPTPTTKASRWGLRGRVDSNAVASGNANSGFASGASRPRPWQRRAAWAALALASLAAIAPRPVVRPRNAMLMEAIDVGQGDSLLLITPEGKTLLVDGGGFGGGPRQQAQDFDIGEEVVSAALWSRGIRHLDAVALSHAHSDHMGGLPAVLNNFHPSELWVGNNPRFAAYNALLAEAATLHVQVRTLRAGDAFSFGSEPIHVLAPSSVYQPGVEPSNNDSLVLHVGSGPASVLLEGDAEAPIEAAMLNESGLESALLKVGHHGSITSTRPAFLSRVAPRWAVISCGLHNRYGHPRQEVLEELQSAHVRTFLTETEGAVCFTLDGKTVAAQPGCGVPAAP